MLFVCFMSRKCAPAPGANPPACVRPAARASATVGYLPATARATTRSAARAARVLASSGLSGCDSSASPMASVGTVLEVFAALPFELPAADGLVVNADDPPLSLDARPTANAAAAIATAAITASAVQNAPRRPRVG